MSVMTMLSCVCLTFVVAPTVHTHSYINLVLNSTAQEMYLDKLNGNGSDMYDK